MALSGADIYSREEHHERKNETFIVMVAVSRGAFLSTAAQASSDTSVSSLQNRLRMRKTGRSAQADLDQAKEKRSRDVFVRQAEWRPAEAKFESMVLQQGPG